MPNGRFSMGKSEPSGMGTHVDAEAAGRLP